MSFLQTFEKLCEEDSDKDTERSEGTSASDDMPDEYRLGSRKIPSLTGLKDASDIRLARYRVGYMQVRDIRYIRDDVGGESIGVFGQTFHADKAIRDTILLRGKKPGKMYA